MNRLTDFSMKNIVAVFIVILMLFGAGSYSATTLKVESMPDISFPFIMINTKYIAPPKDVLDAVTKPLEKAVANVEGLKNLSSTSNDNFSQIFIELEQGKKPDDVKKDIESLIANVKLPQSAERPQVLTTGFASLPVYFLAITGKQGMNQTELNKIYNDTILPGFNSLKGIDHVDSIGNQEATLTMKLDANAILNYGMTPSQVSQLIRSNMISSPAGTVDFNGNTQMIRVRGEFDTIYSLDNMKITTPKGETLLLKHLAKIEAINESTFIARIDGNPAIGIHLYKTKATNTVEFANAVDQLIESWEKTEPGISFHTIRNGAESIKQSIHGMIQEGILGAILASFMILFFLRNIRMTLIVLVSIPLSIFTTLLFMAPLGISLNIMTLGGIAIAIGRVVDDSIVVIENIYTQLAKAHERNESVIKYATKQVSSAITSSTLTTVGVFAPLGFIGGIVGEIFRPFALTLVCALLSSLLVAVTVIPMLAKLLVMNNGKLPAHEEQESNLFSMRYKRVLVWSLNHPTKTMVVAGLLFVLSIGIVAPRLAQSFMPESEEDKQLQFQVKMPQETTLKMMDATMKEIEAMMDESKDTSGNPLFVYKESLIGYDNSSNSFANKAMLFTKVSDSADAKKIVKEYKEKIGYLLPKNSEVQGKVVTAEGSGSTTDFTYTLKGEEQRYLQKAASIVEAKMKEFPQLYEIKDSISEMKTEVDVKVNQNNARLYGLSTSQVLDAVRSWVNEDKIGDLKLDDVLYATKVQLDPKYKDSIQTVGNFTLNTPSGVVRLKDVATIRQTDAPVSITREKQVQVVKVTAKIDSVDKGGISKKLTKELDALDLPSGVDRETKGVSDDIRNSFSAIFIAMAASIFIVYLVMVLAFGNASAPFAILFSLPLAAIGGIFGLFITRESVNITSLIGFLMLVGIVVTNAIVLVDRVQQLREQGHEMREALVEAGMTRLRPIIMTAGATIIALIPLALGMSKGAIISRGLAVVVIGGLTTSTVLTLVVVPIAYELIYKFKKKLLLLFFRKKTAN
ncbi:efflux RND transporter permease subunit [Paenibacillus elgii]|uniref:efflux RND transporter permease subunit n=1 Tax=Paenibacillus elgii TaxID=189691 RepID=UPI00203C397B|nr:efflux RND transporter permease subunit [Paenibacillus elgii]MCM3273724.1 efflux RND transporter permease subunit [Paenibacillus elgii]